MGADYMPVIIPEAEPDVAALQEDLTRNKITHVKTRAGEVYRIFDRLNKKSVPLNDASAPPSKPRISYNQVESFGTMIDPNPAPTPEATPDVLSPDNLELAILRSAAAKQIANVAGEQRRKIGEAMGNGERRTITNRLGVEIGMIWKTSPKPKFVIESMDAVLPVAMDKGMEIVDMLPDPGTPEEIAAIEVLTEHAPGLLRQAITKSDFDDLAEEVKKQWEETGRVPIGWGIKDPSDGALTIKPNDAASRITANIFNRGENVLALTEGAKDE